MNIIKTDNVSVAYQCETNAKINTGELFNMVRGASKQDVVSRCLAIWQHDMDLFVALMFYMRDIRKNPTIDGSESFYFNDIPKGKGEKLLAYWMALWLLNVNELIFAQNCTRFVRDIGYFKDCLIMAKMALGLKYSDNKIMIILMPLAIALAEDEGKIIKAHMNKQPREKLSLSLASKWAPRQGKSYSMLIPYMKTLCGITGPKSDAKWRKYIQSIVRATTTDTVETLLSTKNYDKIEFKAVPSKAFNLYKNAFARTPELVDRFATFNKRVNPWFDNIHVSNIQPQEILTPYLYRSIFGFHGDKKYEDSLVEDQWKCYLDDAKKSSMSLDREDITLIPMIDVSGSMFDITNDHVSPIKVALTLGIMLSQINTGVFERKSITFSTEPLMMDIEGDTAIDQISSIFGELNKPNSADASIISTDFVKAFECLLEFCLENNITADCVSKIKIIALSDMEFDHADSALGVSKLPLQAIREKFANNGYQVPQIIYWNLSGHNSYAPCIFDDIGVATICGFEPSIIEEFLETGVMDPSLIPLQILNEYKKLVL
jgi:hypothetical protein